jgi:hypothetical protein
MSLYTLPRDLGRRKLHRAGDTSKIQLKQRVSLRITLRHGVT